MDNHLEEMGPTIKPLYTAPPDLAAEVERLQGMVKHWNGMYERERDICDKRGDEVERLTAQRDELLKARQALGADLHRVTAERDELLADAKRYRWLRNVADGELGCGLRALNGPYFNAQVRGDRLDTAVDSAIAAAEKGGAE